MKKTLAFLAPERCALMVVDIQERLMRVIPERDRATGNSVLLVKCARTLGLPILATTQYAAKIGPLVPEITSELGAVTPVDKMEFDCFRNREIRQGVKALPEGRDTLLVCGVETHICIYQTVLGGLLAGHAMWVAADAVASRADRSHELGLARIREIGATVAGTEMIIYELLQRAGTTEFKALLPFLK